MAEYNIGDKFIVEIVKKTDEPLAPYISGQTKNVTVYQLKGIPFMLDADTLSNFERFEERKKGKWLEDFDGFETIYRCSKCSEEPLTKYGTMHDYVLSEFCPNCGADCREEE